MGAHGVHSAPCLEPLRGHLQCRWLQFPRVLSANGFGCSGPKVEGVDLCYDMTKVEIQLARI